MSDLHLVCAQCKARLVSRQLPWDLRWRWALRMLWKVSTGQEPWRVGLQSIREDLLGQTYASTTRVEMP